MVSDYQKSDGVAGSIFGTHFGRTSGDYVVAKDSRCISTLPGTHVPGCHIPPIRGWLVGIIQRITLHILLCPETFSKLKAPISAQPSGG
jgi:hypothetical protein